MSAVSEPDRKAADEHGVTARFFLVGVTTERLENIARMMEAGEISTRVGAVLPLTAARDAHEMLEGIQPRPPGKIVLQVAG
jgi:NADPH:quinone reductase-like Zn-dependent oxidoreductase